MVEESLNIAGRQVSNLMCSITEARGLDRPDTLDAMIWLQPPERYRLPAPAGVFGDFGDQAKAIAYSLQTPRFVDTVGCYVAILNNAIVSPDGLIWSNNKIVYESVYPWQLENFESGFPSSAARLQLGSDVDSVSLGNKYRRAFYAREGGDVGYFHFMCSILYKLGLFKRMAGESMGVIVNPQERVAREALDLLNIKSLVSVDEWAFVETLYVPAPSNREGDHFSRSCYSARLIDEILRPLLVCNKELPRRVFLGRKDAVVRALSNELEISERLSVHGFETVTVGNMSLNEQIELFSSTTCLCAPHGAGLANMLFMPKESTIIEICTPDRLWPTYRTMASRHGLRYFGIIGSRDSKASAHPDAGNNNFICDSSWLDLCLSKAALSD